MKYKATKLLILTGAGYTKNFGGFLAKEMWAKIFNHPQLRTQRKLKDVLLNDDDFESVFLNVMDSQEFTEIEKDTLQLAIKDAYKKLDDTTRTWVFNDQNPLALNTYKLFGELFKLFVGTGAEKGFFFTLNQDLFMERQSHYRLPGAPFFLPEFYNLSQGEFKDGFFVTLEDNKVKVEEKLEKDLDGMAGLVYIKLHGSYGWKSSDGKNQMVIGKNKQDSINKEPLLRCYFDIFRNVIKEGDKKLLIIGYGFRDPHINKLILDGVTTNNLKLFIITTQSLSDFKKIFDEEALKEYKVLLEAIDGYFPYRLSEIFPPNQEHTTHFQEIKDALLF